MLSKSRDLIDKVGGIMGRAQSIAYAIRTKPNIKSEDIASVIETLASDAEREIEARNKHIEDLEGIIERMSGANEQLREELKQAQGEG